MTRDGLLPPPVGARARGARRRIHRDVRRARRDHRRLRAADEIAKLVNIGTLFAFLIVNIGVVILRRTQPDMERGFRVRSCPRFPIVGGLLCIYLMTKLPAVTWLRFGVCLPIGLRHLLRYGRTHSSLQRGEDPRDLDVGARVQRVYRRLRSRGWFEIAAPSAKTARHPSRKRTLVLKVKLTGPPGTPALGGEPVIPGCAPRRLSGLDAAGRPDADAESLPVTRLT